MPQPPAPPPGRPGRPFDGRDGRGGQGPRPGYRPTAGRMYGAPPSSPGAYAPGGPAGPPPSRRRRSGLSIGMRAAAGLLSLAILISSGVAWSFYKNFVSDVQTITLAR